MNPSGLDAMEPDPAPAATLMSLDDVASSGEDRIVVLRGRRRTASRQQPHVAGGLRR